MRSRRNHGSRKGKACALGTGVGVLLWRRARVRTLASRPGPSSTRWSNTSTTPSALRSLSLSVLRQSLKSPAMMTGSPSGADSITVTDQRLQFGVPVPTRTGPVDDIAMHVGLRRLEHAMQDAALLIGVVGNVVVGLRSDGELAEQGVAMVPMVIHGIHAIRGMVLGAGKEFVLRRFRPCLCPFFSAP